MAQTEQPRMVTPEAVALEFSTANVGSRILAFLIDIVIIGVVMAAGLFVLAIYGDNAALPLWLVISILVILIPGWYLGYFVASETLWRGRTVGKAAMGLRVVTKEGGPVRFRHAAVRALLGLVDFVIGSGFFAVMFILLSRDNQRLGDMVAGTLVLRERSGLPAPAPVTFQVPPGLEHYAATLDVSGLRIEEYQVVRTFLLRAPSLPPAPRTSLAMQLATPLAERLRPPPPQGVPPELFLHCVAAVYQRRQPAGTPGAVGTPGAASAQSGTSPLPVAPAPVGTPGAAAGAATAEPAATQRPEAPAATTGQGATPRAEAPAAETPQASEATAPEAPGPAGGGFAPPG
jgi:uncharacterized RDD family membrane protein YckC